jgi:hypothetical protein
LYKTLKIKVDGMPYWEDTIKDGWDIINNYTEGITYISQRQNALMTKIIVGVPGTTNTTKILKLRLFPKG